MAIPGLLPSNFLIPTPYKPHLPPLKFKIKASTAQFVGTEYSSISNQKNPEGSHLQSLAENTQSIRYSIGQGGHKIDERVYLSNQTNITVCESKQVHGRFVKLGACDSNPDIRNELLRVYSKDKESLDDARRLFDEIPRRRMRTYAAMIGAYCRSEKWLDAFAVLGLMISDDMLPDKYLVPTILKACGAVGVVKVGKMVHGYVIRNDIGKDVFVGNALIDMYANLRNLRYSKHVFDTMNERDVVSWTALVTAYMDGGLLTEALDTFRSMQLHGVKADLISWNALVSGFAQNGEIECALQFLEEMQLQGLRPNVNTWNGIISGCAQSECYEAALDSLLEMLNSPENLNIVTIVSVLPACSGLKDLNCGQVIHGYAFKLQLCGNVHVQGSLIDMYSKCGMIDYAEKVFVRSKHKNTALWNEMIAANVNEGKMMAALGLFKSMKDSGIEPDEITYHTIIGSYARDGKKDEAYQLLREMSEMNLHPNIVTFNILISGFQQSGLSHEALKLFQAMQSPPFDYFPAELIKVFIRPNSVTVTGVLAACADLDLWHQGKQVHGYALRNALETNVFVSSALVDLYGKCYDLDSATKVFWRMANRNTISWNTLIGGYSNSPQPQEAFILFKRMLEEGFEPSPVTFAILLLACGEIGALGVGRELHGYMVKYQLADECSNNLASALINMYAKCGSISQAKLVFESETHKDVGSWNSMISSFAAHGMAKNAIALFEKMEISGIKPDSTTFVALLSVCSHDCLVDRGWNYFNSMTSAYGITPSLEHYTCMVSIMGAAGLLDEALEFIRQMPFKPDACVWVTLLKACRTHSNPEIGERAARVLFEIEPSNACNYILLSNMYASVGFLDYVKDLRSYMKDHQLMTIKQCSFKNVDHKMHSFKGGKDPHPASEDIIDTWAKLAGEMKHVGHSPQDPKFGDVDEPRN